MTSRRHDLFRCGPAGPPILYRLLAILALVGLWGCSDNASSKDLQEDKRKQVEVPVLVGRVEERSVPVQIEGIGTVQAFSTVSVKSQVEGEITAVHFAEGEEVREGAPLFTLDKRPFEAQIRQVEANIARDKAQLSYSRRQLERYTALVDKGFIARQQYDAAFAEVAALEATLKANEASLEAAQLRLGYCTIQAPITGVAGGLKLNRGNLVKANDNERPLVILNQIQPIYGVFSVPERNLSEIKKYMGKRKLEVLAHIPGDPGGPEKGELAYMENAVDTKTGTIQLKGRFSNKAKRLWPGQFVNMVLTLYTEGRALVVPSQAIQSGQQGTYVYVVTEDLKAEYRLVEVGRRVGQEVVILKGLAPGERVVLDGQLRLADGSRVKIVQNP